MARRRLPGRDSRGRFVKGHGIMREYGDYLAANSRRRWYSGIVPLSKFLEIRKKRAARKAMLDELRAKAAELKPAVEPHGFTMTHGGFTMTHGRRRH